MRYTQFEPKLASGLKRVLAACRTLPDTADRPRARRNARQRVLSALRSVRAQLDREYPALKVGTGAGRTHLTFEGRVARLKRQGYVLSGTGMGLFAAAGVPVKYVRGRTRAGGETTSGPWIPKWAGLIGAHEQSKLRLAKKSKRYRDAVLAQAALLQD